MERETFTLPLIIGPTLGISRFLDCRIYSDSSTNKLSSKWWVQYFVLTHDWCWPRVGVTDVIDLTKQCWLHEPCNNIVQYWNIRSSVQLGHNTLHLTLYLRNVRKKYRQWLYTCVREYLNLWFVLRMVAENTSVCWYWCMYVSFCWTFQHSKDSDTPCIIYLAEWIFCRVSSPVKSVIHHIQFFSKTTFPCRTLCDTPHKITCLLIIYLDRNS